MRHATQVWSELESVARKLAEKHGKHEFTAIIDTWGRVSIGCKSQQSSKELSKEMRTEIEVELGIADNPSESLFKPWLGPCPVLDLNSDKLLANVVESGRVALPGGPMNA